MACDGAIVASDDENADDVCATCSAGGMQAGVDDEFSALGSAAPVLGAQSGLVRARTTTHHIHKTTLTHKDMQKTG